MPEILTVAIPTFDRPLRVCERIRELLPQLNGSVKLLIIDNNSPDDVENYVRIAFPDLPENVHFRRNRSNVGLAGNICRCIEYAESEWVWLLGDDDQVMPDAIAAITEALAAVPENHHV